ncbi:MAG: spore cortex-lytic enzyme [Ruminococcaceae bacterium]|nr:spore cortex-lytic enzyme [Oscillospiraceae bacterium]
MKRKHIIISAVICLLLAVICINVSAVSKSGSRGEEVRKIQTKLKNWGYYNGSVDGVYGWQTENAVRSFQKKNGLTADGVAGEKTLNAMGIFSSGGTSSSSSGGANNANIELLARVINGEARGEPYEGQVAVGAVVLNRVDHPSFPNSISGVVYQKGAFTAVDDGQINAQMYASSRRAARDALNGWDPTGGAIYYYNPKTATNQWIRSREIICTIGGHVFCN